MTASNDPFSLSFDSKTLRTIERIAGFEAVLEPQLKEEMQGIVDLLQIESKNYMWGKFKNPTGPLEDSVQTEVQSAYLGRVYSDSPYAWRREEGFSGKTDALGRFYAEDPGIHFFRRTLRSNKALIRSMLKALMVKALAELKAP